MSVYETGGSPVRVLSVYEHPPLMEHAFASAKERIYLISPWIRANVVDETFLGKLAAKLKTGVEVTIAYGIGRSDKGARPQDVAAVNALLKLSERYSNFRLKNKKNTHAKVLLVDRRFFVTTSFNWLSFRGDPTQPFREEEGTYVEGDEIVDYYYERLLQKEATAGD